MNENELNRLVKTWGGLRTVGEARRALGATLGAVRCALEDEDALALAKALPPPLARAVERGAPVTVRGAHALYAEAERRERVGLGFAMEHTQVVLQVLAQELPAELVARLRKRLPPDIAGLLRPRRPSEEPPAHVHVHPEHRPVEPQTLSPARPGTAEPIAEAHHALAHAGSVARSDAPHAERMVETAHSTRPGREDETLASTRGEERRR